MATRTNQILLDSAQRYLCEIDFFEQGFTVANPVFNLYDQLQGKNMLDGNMARIPKQQRAIINSALLAGIGAGSFNILARKQRQKEAVEQAFNRAKSVVMKSPRSEKPEVLQRVLRTSKVMLCLGYCTDLVATISCDALKLQLLHQTDELRKRAYLMPRESQVFEFFKPAAGEHSFAAYNEEGGPKVTKAESLFIQKSDSRISNFLRIPPFHEILELPGDRAAFLQANLAGNLAFDFENHAALFVNDQAPMIKERLPRLTPVDPLRVDA